MNNEYDNRLREEDFLSQKREERDFVEDAKKMARNKRSQKGLGKFFKKKESIFSSF